MAKRERDESDYWLLVLALDNHGVLLTCMKRPITAGEENDPESFSEFYADEDGTTWKPGWEPIEERDITTFTANHHCRLVILRTD